MANERPSDLFPISGMVTSHVQEDGCFHQPASLSDMHRASPLTDRGHAVGKKAFPDLSRRAWGVICPGSITSLP